MTFFWPKMLWLLASVPALVVLYLLMLRRKRKAAVRYASLSLVKDAMRPGKGWRRHVPPILMLLAWTLTVLASARPAAIITLPSQRGTVMLATDVDHSASCSAFSTIAAMPK